MEDKQAMVSAAHELGIRLQEDDHSRWRDLLIEKINHLLLHDFEKLISILYRIDVSEKKIRHFLESNTGEDAAPFITDLIIERQLQKIDSRKQFRTNDPTDDEEKW